MTDESKPRLLVLTNDDGLGEPGLEALFQATEGLGERRIIAPVGPQSSCSHAVTTGRSIPIERRGAGRIAVGGTPADCVRLAVHHLAPETTWVLSGINAGGNLGVDIHHSGTVAAVREAVIHGLPGIALSHYTARGRKLDWSRAAVWARRVLEELLERPWTPGTFWNVNFPHPDPDAPEPRIVDCPLDPSPLPLRFRIEPDGARYEGDYQGRARIPSADVEVCFSGQIAVSRVPLIPSMERTPPRQ